MSWLEQNLLPIGLMAGGAAATAFGGGAVGVPMMMGGAGMYGQNQTNAQNIKQADSATGTNLSEAQRVRDWQTQMSNTEMQRKAADLKAAGLNPMLAGLDQKGASTPSGAAGKAEYAKTENSIGAGISSAVAMKNVVTQMQGQESQAMLNKAMATKALSGAGSDVASTKQMEVETAAKKSQLAAIAASAKVETAKAGYDYTASKYDAIATRLNRDAGTANKVVDLFTTTGPKQSPLRKNQMIINRKTGEIIRE